MTSMLETTLLALLAPALAPPPQDPDRVRFEATQRLAAFVRDPDADAARFVREHVAASLRETHGAERLAGRLEAIHDALGGSTLDDVLPDGARSAYLLFAGGGEERWLVFRIEDGAPHGFLDIWLEHGEHLDPDVPPTPDGRVPLTWENLEERLAAEEAAGLAGALLLQVDGEVALCRGFGLANRAQEIPNRPDTVFATGSLPIDFTRAGILLLVDAGVIALDDPLGDFFDGVPQDKRAITVGHLTSGASGLPDFHDRPTDGDPDHHWIDRDEAVRRILAAELLFAPGTGRRHSHSAWGLLAAILEIASEQSYADFLRENFFEPLGMEDTGFNGDPVPAERLAIGYGFRTDGEVNAPPHWGPTSWLVMGSGGMVSTVEDMARWLNGMRTAELLSPESVRRFWSPPGAIARAGDVYGFEVFYTEGPDTFLVLFTNANEGVRRRWNDRLATDLVALLASDERPDGGRDGGR